MTRQLDVENRFDELSTATSHAARDPLPARSRQKASKPRIEGVGTLMAPPTPRNAWQMGWPGEHAPFALWLEALEARRRWGLWALGAFLVLVIAIEFMVIAWPG